MSCLQVPAARAFNPYPRLVQVGEFEVATDGGVWVAIREEARQLGGQGTKKDAVTQALVEYIQRRKQPKVLALFGTVDSAEGHDAKAHRDLPRASGR